MLRDSVASPMPYDVWQETDVAVVLFSLSPAPSARGRRLLGASVQISSMEVNFTRILEVRGAREGLEARVTEAVGNRQGSLETGRSVGDGPSGLQN